MAPSPPTFVKQGDPALDDMMKLIVEAYQNPWRYVSDQAESPKMATLSALHSVLRNALDHNPFPTMDILDRNCFAQFVRTASTDNRSEWDLQGRLDFLKTRIEGEFVHATKPLGYFYADGN